MATPKQGKELHQLKLKLTKDPRATTVKPPTPTKQSPPKIGTMSSSDQPKAPAAKVLKLSDVIIVPARNPNTRPLPTKPASKSTTATSVSQQPSVAHPPTVKSPRQQQVTLISPPIVVKSPRKKQTVLVNPQVVKQVKQQVTLVNPVVVKSPSKARQQPALISGGEGSTKHKPPPLNLVVMRPEPKQASKRQNKRSSQSILPTSRVRTIMKTNIKSSSSDGPLNIGQDSVAVISKATEMFIAELMKGAHKTALESCHKEISYGHLAKTVRKDQKKFLYEILPEKVLVRDYLASLNSQDSSGAPTKS